MIQALALLNLEQPSTASSHLLSFPPNSTTLANYPQVPSLFDQFEMDVRSSPARDQFNH